MELLNVKNLRTVFNVDEGRIQAVRGVSFKVEKGQSIGIVGESGCGKSVSMMSLMRILPKNADINAESILFDGVELTDKKTAYISKLRGNKIGMIFQDSMTSLNPLFTIGNQLVEPLKIHQGMSGSEARKKAEEMISLVEISNPKKRFSQYPHELSGGMRQRIMIAIALSCNPQLLIADEPTTALDVTIAAQILLLMENLQKELGTSIIMITHDLGVVANMCDYIYVMYGGVIVEQGSMESIFSNPKHPYTIGLISCLPANMGSGKKRLEPIMGTPPDLIKPPEGCPFTDRCKQAMIVCKTHIPKEYELGKGHIVKCHLLHPLAQKAGKGVLV